MDDPTISKQSAPSTPSINVPSIMSDSSLHLENLPSRTMQINLLLNSSYNRSPSRTIYSDRFIPNRSGSNFALFDISNSPTSAEGKEDESGTYNSLLRGALFGPHTPDNKDSSEVPACRNIFRFKTETKRPLHSISPVGFDESVPGINYSPVKAPKRFPSHLTSKVTKLCDLGVDDSVCSVCWAQRGTHLAVGTSDGDVEIWDTPCCRRVRTLEGHRLRVGTLAWSSSLLSSGSRDKSILQRDIRAPDDFASKLSGHKSEVCGLKWSYDNRELASGGNDNKLFVWNQHSTQPVLKYCEHTAAVKAIAWSPHLHGLLASGGGTADRCIRFWNTTTNTHLSCMDTGSQVCNLVWSKNVNELVSTHGYSQNQIIVWRYPTMTKLATLTGHTYRVLYLAISPDGQTIVTGAGDETLRFWNVFPSPKSQNTDSEIGASFFGRTTIR
ncbi:Protein FIZZY-RELATED 1 [Hibiscus syriacus]|uniref:Protein FIZZY-RELATED 1 n=1 Tax=Hibiscus syriacus TaxID=106335 RepID=A0A6A3C998_HIBSY|nr:Protein FIZZY-RELATED 1 [Hibiscus syriacus]